MYVVFFDATCSFCQQCVQRLAKCDHRKILSFEPLTGKLAQHYGIHDQSRLVFIDQTKVYRAGQAVLRIFWRLGGLYRCLGILGFLPSWLLDPFYYYVAKRRRP